MENDKFEYELIDDQYTRNIAEYSKGSLLTLSEIMVKPSGCILPKQYVKFYEQLKNFEVYPDDTWVISFPKSGTTWTQEMVWLLLNNIDFEKAKSIPVTVRVPFIEHQAIESLSEPAPENLYNSVETIAKMPRPRIIKSHLSVDLLPRKIWTVKPKVVYVTRDPRDVAISYFHHYKLWSNYQGTMEDFIDVFLNDRCMYSPYWGHILNYHDLKDKSHILFNTYEEMIKDLGGVIRKTAEFLGVSISDELIEKMKDHLAFKNMKNNSKVNYVELLSPVVQKYGDEVNKDELKFMRKGKSGGWKDVLNGEILEKFKKWNEKHLKNRPFKDYPW